MSAQGTPTVHRGTCTPGTATHRHLGPYPGLTYAPQQHGEGIRLAHNGRPVEELAAAVEPGTVAALDALATAMGAPFGDVLDGLKYLRDEKVI